MPGVSRHLEAAAAGASILHLHARDPETGASTGNPAILRIRHPGRDRRRPRQVVPVGAIAAFPTTLSIEQGTSIWMQYLTAYGALIHQGHLATGDFVLITAASSSVGAAAIEIAREEGAISIATTRTSKKKAELLGLGADHVIVTDEEDLAARVQEITRNKGVNRF